ncbi:nicotinamide riboside transporter PnuC [Spirochaeta cellobiosiphila]|uniref:nicotinamide riboside transporter PnuC n=1 Tax=Spirochaeta cellobiosiphila TaxID=504483 RepID=UPI00040822A5|nr:nicotinamide riboside transporter PnuC [Spirochaeta cellobiosiphila]
MIHQLKKMFSGWKAFELIWLSLFSAVAILLTIIWKDNVFGLIVFLTGVLCVVLTAKGNIWSFLYGLVNTLGYAWLAYKNNLFGEMGLNLFFFLPMNFIGFYMWKKHLAESSEVEMLKMSSKGVALTLLVSALGIGLLGYALSLIAGQNTPYIDATTNILSIMATLLTAKRFREQWLLYIVLNVFTVIMWSIRTVNGSPDGPLMIVMWSAYLINAFYGYYNWTQGAKLQEKAQS